MVERVPRFERVGGGGGGGGGTDPQAAERRAERGQTADIEPDDEDEDVDIRLEAAADSPVARGQSRVVAERQNPTVAALAESRSERGELSPSAELISRSDVREQLVAGEEEIERRAAEGNRFAQTYAGGTAIQEAGEEAGRAIDQGDPITGGIGRGLVGGAGFAAGLPGQAVGAAGLAGAEGAERVATGETVESIAFGGARQVESAADNPLETGVAVAAPGVAARGARAAAPRARAAAGELGVRGRGVDRAQLDLAGPRGRSRAAERASVDDLPAEIAGTEPVPGRAARRGLRAGEVGQDIPASRGFTAARFGDPVTSGRVGAAGGRSGVAEGATLSGISERQAAAQEPSATIDEAIERDLEQTEREVAGEGRTRAGQAEALRERAEQREVTRERTESVQQELEAIDESFREDVAARERTRARTQPRQAERQAQRERITERVTSGLDQPVTTTGGPRTTPRTQPPRQPPRGIPGFDDGGGRDDGDEDEFLLFGQENIFPAVEPTQGVDRLLEDIFDD